MEQKKEDSHKIMGVEWAPVKIPFERRMQTLAVFTYMSLFLFAGLCTLSIMYALLFTPFFFLSIMYAGWLFYDREIGEIGGRKREYW